MVCVTEVRAGEAVLERDEGRDGGFKLLWCRGCDPGGAAGGGIAAHDANME